MKKISVYGNQRYGKEIIKYLEMLGGKNLATLTGRATKCIYTINEFGIITIEPDYYNGDIIPLSEVLSAVCQNPEVQFDEENQTITLEIPDNTTATYFPRMMWVWDSNPDEAEQKEIHGRIKTLQYPWIDYDNVGWKNASDIRPIQSDITIEEAEKLLNRKIKRT